MSEVQQSENNNEETLPLSPDCVQKKITSGMIEILVRLTVRREVCLSDVRFDRIPHGAVQTRRSSERRIQL